MTARPHSESSSTGSSRMTRICTASRNGRGLLAQGGPPASRPRRAGRAGPPRSSSWPHCRGGWVTMPVCRAPCCCPSSPAPSCSSSAVSRSCARPRRSTPRSPPSRYQRRSTRPFVRRLSPWVEVALGVWLLLATGDALVVVAMLTLHAVRGLPGARRAGRAPPRAGRLRLLRCAGRLAGDPGDGVAQRAPGGVRPARRRGRAAGRGADRRRRSTAAAAVDRQRRPDGGRRGARRLPRAGTGAPAAGPRLDADGSYERQETPGPRCSPRAAAGAARTRDDDVRAPAGLPQPRVRTLRADRPGPRPSGPSSCTR